MFSSISSANMKEKEFILFDNKFVCAAIYLDQRLKFLNSNYLNADQKNKAEVDQDLIDKVCFQMYNDYNFDF